MKKTVIIGATPNVTRYAYMAAESLTDKGHEIVPVGIKKGEIFDQPILNLNEKPEIKEVDTVTMYIGPQHQEEWMEYIVGLNPKRIIFNPGTENHEFGRFARKKGIEVEEACTLVLLSLNAY
jgi:predicted CoA-binding protein